MFFGNFLLFFARSAGFFLISPLFSKRNIPMPLRLGFAALCTLVLIPPLAISFEVKVDSALFLLEVIKEVAIGYLLGFLFSLLFEAAMLAGQIVGTMAGFSITELFEPKGQENTSIFGKLFALTVFTLFLALDLHHHLLRFLFSSYRLIPLVPSTISIVEASSRLFVHGVMYAFVPLLFLSFVLVTFAVISRALPSIPIFWIGFPAQLLIGIVATALALAFFSEILQKAFFEFLTLSKRILFPL